MPNLRLTNAYGETLDSSTDEMGRRQDVCRGRMGWGQEDNM